MKSNLVIGGTALALVALVVLLAAMSLAPAAVTVSSAPQRSYSWYFRPQEDGRQPVLADDADFLADYPILALGDPQKKSLFLTFDAGYDDGTMASILDTLQEKRAPAAFFVTGHFVDSCPELVRRMQAEGHLVCNHTLHHRDLSALESLSDFRSEVEGLSREIEALTGTPAAPYLRPPEGRYSERTLQMAAECGCRVVFWSFAYKDWLADDQPDPQAALAKILSRTHSGAVVLLHANSATNAAILGELIDRWRAEGYTLRTLDDCAAEIGA